jgi:hypothetical protein
VLDAPAGAAGRTVRWRRTSLFDGGFATLGEVGRRGGPAHAAGTILHEYLLFVALPDGRCALFANLVRAACDLTLLHQEGLRFNLANDLFNGGRRRIWFEGGSAALIAGQTAPPTLEHNPSSWLAVDDLLGIQFVDAPGAAPEPWTVRTFPQRHAPNRSLYYAVLCRPFRIGPRPVAAGDVVQRTCACFVANVGAPERAGEGGRTDRADGRHTAWVSPAVCAWRDDPQPLLDARVAGLDGREYRVVASWTDRSVSVS